MSQSYLDAIAQKVPIIFDGAFGTQVQKENLAASDFNGSGCNEILNLTRPDIVRKIHAEYLIAGANVIETNTFGGSRPKLHEKGLGDRVREINMAGAALARAAADEFIAAGSDRWVCGAMGPTGSLPSSKDPSLNTLSFDALADIFEEQAAALLDGGVDILLIETAQDLLEIRAALYGIGRLFRARRKKVPVHAHCTMEANGRMLLGSDIAAFSGATGMGVDIVGLNCSTGPIEMTPIIEELLAMTDLPVAMLPNAGMPENVDGIAVYRMSPVAFADALAPLVTLSGLPIVGGCCGTSPAHIRELAARLDGKSVAERPAAGATCFLGTGISGVDLEKLARPLIIGERCNAQGSKKTKGFILDRNWDALGRLALEQAEKGAGLLDLCVAINERDDEPETMTTLVSWLSDRVRIPFSVDTTDPAVMEAALKASPGALLLNSINLEKHGERARTVLAMAAAFGCPVIALTIDDLGMAKTIERKMELARALYDLACREFGLPGHFLYIDPLVFTLATGAPADADAAAISLEALRRIKQEMPSVRTAMGVSNVSYGFSPAARRVLNNLMLFHAAASGLDAAIFNPLHLDNIDEYDPVARALGEDLLFNRWAGAMAAYINYFEERAPGAAASAKAAPAGNALPAEKLQRAVLERDPREVGGAIEALLQEMEAGAILDTILLPAMEEVGKRMAAGEMILPFVLQAAEVMRGAIAILEPHLKTAGASNKGKIVLATVFGDVHDIGKNLVGSILRNQGFDVIDLGKQVELKDIVRAVIDQAPDAVGLSALLVTTSREMAACVKEFAKQGISVPLLIGGAAVSADFAARIGRLDNGAAYAGNVYYCRDAFEAAKIIERTKHGRGASSLPGRPRATIGKSTEGGNAAAKAAAPTTFDHAAHGEPPFYGTSAVLRWDPRMVIDKIDQRRLFKAWWGGGRLSDEAFAKAEEQEFKPAWAKLREMIAGESLLDPAALYGFFPVFTHGESVILLDPSDFHSELASFIFPRMPKTGNRSIADYLRPEGDVLAVQIVTIGGALAGRVRALFAHDNRYSIGYFLNGVGGYCAELLAVAVTEDIRRGMGLPADNGRRYSFGYPGMPELEEQKKIFEIMAIEERLGITLTERFQMVPEHSTLGIFIRHPKAEYLV